MIERHYFRVRSSTCLHAGTHLCVQSTEHTHTGCPQKLRKGAWGPGALGPSIILGVLTPCCALQNRLVRSYDFTFGFCIPHSTNSWEAIYDVPDYSPQMMMDYVSRLSQLSRCPALAPLAS